MYNSYDEFEKELSGIWDRYVKQKPYWYAKKVQTDDGKTFEWEDGFKLYTNTKQSLLREQILGETAIRGDVSMLSNFGATSGSKVNLNKKAINKVTSKRHPKDHLRRGSILNDAYWWPFKNDTWLIGGVHGLKIFHFAGADLADDLLWDSSPDRPRMLGRELIGLITFGYRWIYPTKVDNNKTVVDSDYINQFGHVFAPTKKNAAQTATFTDYLNALAKVKNLKELRKMVIGTPQDSYDYSKL